jgi:PAS domain S-box-containing protein
MNTSSREFISLMETFPRGVCVTDPKGTILFVNSRFNKYLELRESELIGENLPELVYGDNRCNEEQHCIIQQAIDGCLELHNQSDTFNLGSGLTLNVELSIYPLFDNDELTGFLIRVKNESVDTRHQHLFMASLGHEFKTPLAIISSYSHLLEKAFEEKNKEDFDSYLGVIVDKVDLLVELIQGMIDTVKLGAGRMVFEDKLVDLGEELGHIVEQLQKTTATHHIKFSGCKNVKIKIDHNRLFQVVSNLITNAVKYSPNREKIDIRLNNGGDYVEISVKDYGIGIHPDEAEHIFEPFYRTMRTRREGFRGLGMGLFLSRQIISHYHGKIWFVTEPNQGTTFFVNLPI